MDLRSCKTCPHCNFYIKSGIEEIPDSYKEDFNGLYIGSWHPTLCLCEAKPRVNVKICSKYHLNEFTQIW